MNHTILKPVKRTVLFLTLAVMSVSAFAADRIEGRVDPAGNLWMANNWDRPDEGFKEVPDEALSTRWGGNGAVVFFGLAKPVRTPMIGPVQAW